MIHIYIITYIDMYIYIHTHILGPRVGPWPGGTRAGPGPFVSLPGFAIGIIGDATDGRNAQQPRVVVGITLIPIWAETCQDAAIVQGSLACM